MTAIHDITVARRPIDAIDAAFLARETRTLRGEPVQAADRMDDRPAHPRRTPSVVREAVQSSVVAELLRLAPDQWRHVADIVESAHGRGRRVIAIAGGASGEGRTTIVDGLTATLRDRGRSVDRVERGMIPSGTGGDAETIVVVDAGVWFPPGPIRIAPLSVVARYCDAAILVRRADEAPCPSRGAALARVGVECLGELETFVAP